MGTKEQEVIFPENINFEMTSLFAFKGDLQGK